MLLFYCHSLFSPASFADKDKVLHKNEFGIHFLHVLKLQSTNFPSAFPHVNKTTLGVSHVSFVFSSNLSVNLNDLLCCYGKQAALRRHLEGSECTPCDRPLTESKPPPSQHRCLLQRMTSPREALPADSRTYLELLTGSIVRPWGSSKQVKWQPSTDDRLRRPAMLSQALCSRATLDTF